MVECIVDSTALLLSLSIDGAADTTGVIPSVYANKPHLQMNLMSSGLTIDIAGFAIANAVPSAGQRTDMRAWANGLIT